jgi:hypothetical protein
MTNVKTAHEFVVFAFAMTMTSGDPPEAVGA